MDGFYLLLGHLVGDYLAQNDWQAANKTNPPPVGDRPGAIVFDGSGCGAYLAAGGPADRAAWDTAWRRWLIGHLACTVHCLLYTLSVWAFSFHWMPLWGPAVVFLAHWPMDRFGLARVWMTRVSGQAAFAAGPLAPWSVIVVDNVFHLLVLAGIAAVAGR